MKGLTKYYKANTSKTDFMHYSSKTSVNFFTGTLTSSYS